MPNWCYNELHVTGDHEDLDRFLNACIGLPAEYPSTPPEELIRRKEPRFCFNALLPIPAEVLSHNTIPVSELSVNLLSILTGQYSGELDSYHWKLLHWGTKWDVYDCNLTKNTIGFTPDSKEIRFNFDTAWSPPIPWFTEAVSRFPMLHFTLHYEEPGMNFAGDVYGSDGETSEHNYSPDELSELFQYDDEDSE